MTTGAIIATVAGILATVVPVVGWLIWRAWDRRVDYVTSQGVRVRMSEKGIAPKEEVEEWAADTIAFWTQWYDPEKVAKALKGHTLAFVDTDRFVVYGADVRGYTSGALSAVATEYADIPGLTKHELGHPVLDAVGVHSAHHEEFRKRGWYF